MPVLINAFFEARLEQLLDLAALVERLFSSAGIEYRTVGGLAAYIYIEQVEPDAGRLTRDIDIVVRRADLERIAQAAGAFGQRIRGLRLILLPELIRMKLTSFRIKNQMHLKDLGEAGLITREVEAGLPPILAENLAQVRARE